MVRSTTTRPTNLSLEYHLRGIVEGTTEDVCVRVDFDPAHYVGGRNWPERRHYDEGSYTTGYDHQSGDFCDAYPTSLAAEALRADDPVAFLDTVTRDPARPQDDRFAAADLLSTHVMPFGDGPNDAIQLPVAFWDTVACPKCRSHEALFDVTRPGDPCRCVGCDVSIPEPSYP